MTSSSCRRFQLAAFLISLLGLYFRWKTLAGRDWWVDEAFQYKNTVGALQPFWQRLTYGELICFPGDYLLTWPFVTLFKDNKWGAGLPHILAAVLSFYLLYLICLRHLKTLWAGIMAFTIFAFSQELIFHAFEFRPYAVLIPQGLAAFYLTGRLFDPEKPLGWKARFGAGLFYLWTILFHAYGVLIVGTSFIFFILKCLAEQPFQAIHKNVGSFIIILTILALPPWLWYATGNPSFSPEQNLERGINTFDFITNPFSNLVQFLKSIFGNLMGYKLFYPLLAGPALGMLIKHRQRNLITGFFLIMIVLPITLILVMDVNKGYWFLQRQFVWVTGLFPFFTAWSWETLTEHWREQKLSKPSGK